MIISLYKRISRYWVALFDNTAIDKKVCLYTILFLVTSLAIPNNKIFFIASAFYVLSIFWHTKSAGATFLYTFFITQMYIIGQRHEILVIAPEELLKNTLYPSGRYLYYLITPTLLLALAATLSLPFQILKQAKWPAYPWSMVGYGVLFVISLVSSMSSNQIPTLAVLYSLNNVFLFGWLLATYKFLKHQPKYSRTTILTTLFFLLLLTVAFETSIASVQFLKRGLINLHIEGTRSISPFGFGPDENPLQFRPVGLTLHANMLASRFVGLLYTILFMNNILSLRKINIKLWYLGLISALLCVFTIILSQSRIGYASVLLPITAVGFLHKTIVYSWLRDILPKFKQYLFLTIPFIAIASFILIDRLLYLQYVFAESAGWNTRLLLIQEAVKLITRYPVLGVGTGMFIPAAFNEQRYDDTPGISIMRYFPEGVHNGFLLLTAENGMVSLLVLIGTLFLIIREVVIARFTFTTKSLILAGIIANLIFMTAQPTSMNFPINILAYYFVGIYLYAKRLHR